MKRGGLFFIGLLSAIVTIVSLNIAFGRSGFYNERDAYFSRYHHCGDMYDRDHKNNNDSTSSNY